MDGGAVDGGEEAKLLPEVCWIFLTNCGINFAGQEWDVTKFANMLRDSQKNLPKFRWGLRWRSSCCCRIPYANCLLIEIIIVIIICIPLGTPFFCLFFSCRPTNLLRTRWVAWVVVHVCWVDKSFIFCGLIRSGNFGKSTFQHCITGDNFLIYTFILFKKLFLLIHLLTKNLYYWDDDVSFISFRI